MATLDYMSLLFARSFVADGESLTQFFYDHQKLRAEKFYTQRRLDRLQMEIDRLTEGIRTGRDIAFNSYIKEKTGYEWDVFAVQLSSAEAILARNKINTPQEADDANVVVGLFQERKTDAEKVAVLLSLLEDYHKMIRSSIPVRPLQSNGYTQVVERTVTADTVSETVVLSNRPFTRDLKIEFLVSPDGKRRLWIHQKSGKNPRTSVSINFPKGSGAVFEALGYDPDFRALWKDNHTMVFEITPKLQPRLTTHTLENYDDKISVEYILKEGTSGEAGTADVK